jgi:hypothetical protein
LLDHLLDLHRDQVDTQDLTDSTGIASWIFQYPEGSISFSADCKTAIYLSIKKAQQNNIIGFSYNQQHRRTVSPITPTVSKVTFRSHNRDLEYRYVLLNDGDTF